MYAGDFADAVDDIFQMFQVGNIQNDIDVGLAVAGAGFNVADVGFGIADHGCDLFQHAEAVVAENGELYWVGAGRSIIVGPLHVNLAFRLIHEIHDVGTIEAVNRHAFAAGNVADDGFAANRVTTTGAVDQQVALSGDANGVVVLIAAKNSPYHAGEAAGFL